MTPFLYRVAETFFTRYGNELYKNTFVFPNRRAGLFFQKYLAEIAGKPVFSPKILTVQEVFEVYTSYQLADKIELLVLLHDCFLKISNTEESFDEFLYWGEMLINDFNDVDKHLANAEQLFRNVLDLKTLDGDLSFLEEPQIEAIRRFWTNFMPSEGNDTKQRFQETWQILFQLYITFREELLKKGYAYEGMMFRDVAERALAKKDIEINEEQIVFVGFNAITPSEIALLSYLRDIGKGDFYWDYDSPLVRDKQNRASLWVEDNLRQFPSKLEIKKEINPVEKPEIISVGIPSGVGQAKHATQILNELLGQGLLTQQTAINTAIVLPDENLLLPVLYSIPEQIEKINVTMGYGLSHASLSSLIDHISVLQRNIRKTGEQTVFYHRFVLSILNHPLVIKCSETAASQLKEYILKNNRIVVSEEDIPTDSLLKLIFSPITDWRDISSNLSSIIQLIYSNIASNDKEVIEDKTDAYMLPLFNEQISEDRKPDAAMMDLEREFMVYYYRSITRLKDLLTEAKSMTVDTYFRLLKRLVQGISVPFSGEPLSGLQVMGVLETRAIDFENIIILSINEGVFPLKKSSNSFIPYTLRKGFGLPVYEHQDSTYAYHFYRMISRAKRIYMLYDTRTEDTQTGEVSRYYHQLKYLYSDKFNIKELITTYNVSAPETESIIVQKKETIIKKLSEFLEGGNRHMSVSMLNKYISCPLQFYFTEVEGLSEEEEVQESVEANIFGSMYHKIMELLYTRYANKTVTPDDLMALIKDNDNITSLIEKVFAEEYFKQKDKPQPLLGQHYLIGEILRKYVKQTLKQDIQYTPFIYIDSEKRFRNTYQVTDKLKVNFKGIIDRIDKIGERYRIIDYKTGQGESSFTKVEDLFNGTLIKRSSQILQVLLYAMFYDIENPGLQLSPSIYYLRSIFNKFDPEIKIGTHPINDTSIYFDEIKENLNACLTELFNPEIPFTQTSNNENCKFCQFSGICGTLQK